MARHDGEVPVIETGPSQLAILECETQRLDQVQPGSRVGAQAYDISRIRRNLRLKQNQIKH